jgi:hypothetical protein
MKKAIVLVALLTSACSSPISESDVVGTYVANYQGDTSKLSINADHTYSQVIELTDGNKVINTATWSSVAMGSGDIVVEFSKFRIFPSYTVEGAVEANWSASLTSTFWGNIQFCYDEDVGYCFVKQQRP